MTKSAPGTIYLRHGDVLFEVANEVPSGAKPTRNHVLAQGTATGHSHYLVAKGEREKSFSVFEYGGNLYVQTGSNGATVDHQEHGPADLEPEQVYAIRIQREFDPEGDRAVED